MTQANFEAYRGNEPYCFVSYSHADSAKVFEILNSLSDRRFRIWYDDTMEIGGDFRIELKQRIQECDAFILFMSENSMNSSFCGMEVITAHQYDKKIYPIVLGESVQTPASLKLILDNLQHVQGFRSEDRYLTNLIDSLPPHTMERLVIDDGVVVECADNGTSIDIPEGVVAIGPGAFHGRTRLRAISLPQSLKAIGDEAFRGCSSLQEMILHEGIETVGHSAFRDCVALHRLHVANPKTVFQERSFENCPALIDVSIPDEAEEIFEACFNSCRGLKEFAFPAALKVVGDSAFADCSSLNDIELPASTIKLDARAFADCVNLESVSLPAGLSKIGAYAFKGCTKLEHITLPNALTDVSSDAFRECTALESITVAGDNRFYKSVDGVLFSKNKSTLVTYPSARSASSYEIPDSVTIISRWAFCQADNLTSIEIPDSVESIGEGAFYSASNLGEVILPDSLSYIDDIAFRFCENLRSLTIPPRVTHIGWGALLDCHAVTVYCAPDSYAWRYCEDNDIKHQILANR